MKKQTKTAVIFSATLSVLLAAGCAAPHVVEDVKASDADLSCAGLQAEIDEARQFEEKAREEKGVTGGNVVRGLLFWPAIAGTYINANEAIEAAKDRREHLLRLRQEKGC